MDSDLDRTLVRLREVRAWRVRASQEAVAARAPTSGAGDARTVVGARVFDTVTGQEGEVVGGTRENIIVSAPK